MAVPCRVKDVTLKKDMTMKKLRIVLLATCAVCTFGCNNDDDNTDPKLLLREIGSSCKGCCREFPFSKKSISNHL